MNIFPESHKLDRTLSSGNAPAESSTASEYSSTSIGAASDGELILATRNPKKRAGRRKFKETRHPVYRGVRSRDKGKWVCEVRDPVTQSRVWLGTHPTAVMAARAHDVAALAMRGRSACLNFADSVWRLPVPESSDIKDIQKAAAAAAEAFRSEEEEEVQTREMPENVHYDEEELPGFLASMAEGLMVSPPKPEGQINPDDDVDDCVDMPLWNFLD
uniref:dehydration-responsive element-binding protein 1E-like n=1 Tax=Erigeron canadensis TaxID=72917 RepID=UPI001CB94241|nr:dehydration-responsive element-binding protein 1E-like [Erigeron canadensis]